MDEAYAVQEALAELLAEAKGPVVGYKIALTSRVVQEMVGMSEPAAGVVFANTVHRSPASVSRDDYVHLGIECEIAVQLGADLPPEGIPYDRESVAEAVESVATAFELIDDRYADYSQARANRWAGLAANVSNAGAVLGPQVRA